MEFGLLGPLTLVEGGRDVTPARPKQRALLSLLLLRRGEVVAGPQLIEALWGTRPPESAQTALHGHISSLRKLLGAERIRTRPPGYLLQVSPGELDLSRFEALIAEARDRDDPEERSTRLREALSLWRGEPFPELEGEPFAEREVARLEELRLAAVEDRIDADLALGRHHELVPELEPLAAEHVFRERLRGQLMLALYRCGRQADALHAFQSGRRALVDELGITPGPALQQLELRILRQDPGLELPAASPPPAPVRYARSGEVSIAYQVTGDGPLDLVLISGFVSHLEKDWEEPRHARFLERLGSTGRLIRFDKRGTGLSDRPAGLPDLETRMDDVRAVMDAVESRRAVLFGYSEGAPMAILFAATYPERTRALILYGAYSKRIDPDDDYPWAPTREVRTAYIADLERDWGIEADMKLMCPSADEAMARWWGERCRAAASPGTIRAINEMNSLIDVRALLPAIRVPTLVVHRGTDYDVRVEEGRYIAERIAGARFTELPGADHFVGVDPDQILDAVEPFLAESAAAELPATGDRAVVTLVVIDVAGASDARRGHVRVAVARHLGRELEGAPHRIVASFDGPARAVRFATEAASAAGVEVRAGVHTGELVVADGRAHGLALDVAAAAAAAAAPGEVLVSRTVTDLVAGSGLDFNAGSRRVGERELLAVAGADYDRPMVGRAEELERLEHALRQAGSGAGSVVLMAGDAGIGKTRLVDALAARARAAGFQRLVGRCLDLIGTELPFQPFADALRSLEHELPFADGRATGSQLQVFEDTVALLDRAAIRAPVLLVIEDLHWADASTLGLVAYLAHNLDARRVLVLATYRADESASAERLQRLVAAAGRSDGASVLELGPLAPGDVMALIDAPTPALASAIVARSEGNPFFAEELMAAAGDGTGELPRGVRDLLLRRLSRLDRRTKGVLRLAAAAGRDMGYPLLRAAAALPEHDVREALRRAVEHGVLVTDRDRYRFRHALLAEAVYGTLLPGEREDVHARLATELARGDPPAPAAELAPHWAAAGRAAEALGASIAAARDAESVFAPAEALAHLERALALWPAVSDAAGTAGLDLAELTSWTAAQALATGAAPRAAELGQAALALVGDGDRVRSALLHARLGRYLLYASRQDAGVAAFKRAVELVPEGSPPAERAQVLAALGNALMLGWRHDESRAVCEEALRLARAVGERRAEFRALFVLGVDLAYVGRGEDGLVALRDALRLAEEDDEPDDVLRAYICLTDTLTMLGRPSESARVAAAGVEAVRRYGAERGVLYCNQVEALVAAGEWDEADRVSATALREITANWPHNTLTSRAELEVGRGEFDAARAHLEAALATVREDVRGALMYDPVVVELALWEHRWADADAAVGDALARAQLRDAEVLRIRLCAQGLRAQAELAELARVAGDVSAVDAHLGRARELLDVVAGAAPAAAAVTPNADGWRALADAEHGRAAGIPRPDLWAEAAATFDRLERPPLAGYCRWRQAEALAAAGADAAVPLHEARALAERIGARPLLRELEALADRG